jgi:hypothetical protein
MSRFWLFAALVFIFFFGAYLADKFPHCAWLIGCICGGFFLVVLNLHWYES